MPLSLTYMIFSSSRRNRVLLSTALETLYLVDLMLLMGKTVSAKHSEGVF